MTKRLQFLVGATRRLSRRFKRDQRGNVLLLTGLAILILTFATGMGIDYSRAMRLQTKLNAAADAAALAAVTQPMMLPGVTDKDASDASNKMFMSQIAGLSGLIISASQPTISVTGNDAATTTRTAIVSYVAQSSNAFAGILGMASLPIHGSSTATATAAPNIDFYIALDTSPSMALPTTSDGIATLDTPLTCSFACHTNKIENNYSTSSTASVKGLIRDNSQYAINKSNLAFGTVNNMKVQYVDGNNSYIYVNQPVTNTINSNLKAGDGKTTIQSLCRTSSSNATDICVYNSDGSFVDSYWYALNKGVHLRVTDERAAIADLMGLAQTYATQNNRTYHAALYTFDHLADIGNSTVTTLTDLASVTAAANKIDLVTVNDKQANGCPPAGCSSSNTYLFTSFYGILNKMLNGPDGLPAKSGTGATGSTPQAFLFLVTDGMSDENIGSGRTRAQMQAAQIAQCQKIKDRGVKIAILYTEYTTDSIKDDEPSQRAIADASIPNIAPALTSCASSPDLMYTVKTNESITDALQSLFTKAVATARLSQ
jgi:Flp pilus assembly protein TadG